MDHHVKLGEVGELGPLEFRHPLWRSLEVGSVLAVMAVMAVAVSLVHFNGIDSDLMLI